MRPRPDLSELKARICGLSLRSTAFEGDAARSRLESALSVTAREGLHEICASSPRHTPSALGFAFGLACSGRDHRVVWIFHSPARCEIGEPYAPGLKAWGLEPGSLVLVRVNDARALLAATEEVLHSGAADAVLVSSWGALKPYDLTASRRIGMAADRQSCQALMVLAQPPSTSTAARTRWSVSAARSTPMAAQAPGRPAVHAHLLRSRRAVPPGEWIVEWDRENRSFAEMATASGRLVSLSADRQVAQGASNQWRVA
jgi:protein ImuA